MRRRIDTFDLSDVTDRPYAWDVEECEESGGGVTLALYNDGLWNELEEARERVGDLETRLRKYLAFEPLDEVELALLEEFKALSNQNFDNRLTSAESVAHNRSIRERAIANAKTKNKP